MCKFNTSFIRVALLLAAIVVALAAGATNVILMIGDGMGPDSIAAAGAYRYGRDYHVFGGTQRLALEMLAQQYFVTTYSSEGAGYDFTWGGGDRSYPTRQATDSAAAATALATGMKTYNAGIGVDPQQRPILTILEMAQGWGEKTGIVTTVPISHATPAAFAAHNANRNNYNNIASNILRVTQPDVVMGAGNPDGAPNDPSYNYIGQEDWAQVTHGDTPYRLVQTREEFQRLATQPETGKVLGLFRNVNCLPYCTADGAKADPTLPTLKDMTLGALTTLDNPNGFFLMVEGGAIDWCNHANDLTGSIGETLAFDEAVAAVQTWIAAHGGWEQNLLIITADHETGYLHDVTPTNAGALPTVAWGEGYYPNHTNRLVLLYAQGVGSDTFALSARDAVDFERGAVRYLDNTMIFPVMARALRPQVYPCRR